MNNNLAEEYKKELIKNSKYRLLYVNINQEKEKEKLNTLNTNNLMATNPDNSSDLNSNSISISDSNDKPNLFKSLPQITDEQKEEYKKLNQRFKELRNSHSLTQADKEAEQYVSNLRDIGEYNRWSLKLIQKWLITFYNDKFWIQMGISMLNYKKLLNPEDIHLDVCNEFLDGYYFPKENKITLCTNTLTNYEKPDRFRRALKRNLILMYDNVRSTNYDFNNCYHLACSEIRAANLADYCSGEYSLLNAYTNVRLNKKRHVDCVKSTANAHLMTYYENCAGNSMEYINTAFDKCYLDNSPIKDFNIIKPFF